MMGSGMINGWGWGMMGGVGLVWLLIVILVVLAIVALAKYVFSGRRG
ncbi:MAG: hypothetical protein ACYCZB_02425 [Acidiphilium sp.]